MKLHLPKLLLTAVLAACSMAEAAMTTPPTGKNTFTWTGTEWLNVNGETVTTLGRNNSNGDDGKGAFMIMNADCSTNPQPGNTSDGGGIHVKEGIQVENMSLGQWAGTIQVDAGAYLDVWGEYLKSMVEDDTTANVWVDGELNLREFKGWDGKAKQKWHIGQNGHINLENTSSLGGNKWHIELVHEKQREEAEIEGLTNRIRTEGGARLTHTFISAAGNLSGAVASLTVYDSAGEQLEAGSDYSVSHSANGLGISYSAFGYASVDLTWAGGESDVWVEKGACWVDASGTATSFLNDDNVTFAAAAEGVSTVVTIGGDVTTGTVAINDSYTFTASGAAALTSTGGITVAEGKTLTKGGAESLTIYGDITGQVNVAEGALRVNDSTGVSFTIGANADLYMDDMSSVDGALVTGQGDLYLNMSTNAEGNGDSRIILAEGSDISKVYVSGVAAYNKDQTALASNFRGADLHLTNSSVLLVRNGLSGSLDAANIGDIHFDGAGELRVYGNISNAVINDDVYASNGQLNKTDTGTITLAGVVTASNIVNKENGTLKLTNANNRVDRVYAERGTTAIANGTYTKAYASAGTLNIADATVKNVRLEGSGTVTITGNSVIGVAGEIYEGRSSGLYAHTGTLNIGDGSTKTLVTATRLETGDGTPGNNNHRGGVTNVKKNATLVITAAQDHLGDTGQFKNHGFMVGAWGYDTVLNVEGTILAQNVQMATGEKTGVVNLESGSMLATKGIRSNVANASSIELNLKQNATLVLGSEGINNLKSLKGYFGAGVVGIYANATISENLTLGDSTTGTTFNTQLYEWGTDPVTGEVTCTQGTNGGELTISGEIANYSETAGKLVKAGAGTLVLTAANTYTGGTVITGGVLKAAHVSALSTGGVTLDGGTLETIAGASIYDLNYISGELVHDGLAVNGISFSGGTLDNSANTGGTLTLNGSLALAHPGYLTQVGTGGSYSEGDNGFYTGDYLVISGGNIELGTDFKVTGTGNPEYKKTEDGLTVSVERDTSTFFVNQGSVTASSTIESEEGFARYHVKEKSTLVASGDNLSSLLTNNKTTGEGTIRLGVDATIGVPHNSTFTTTFGGTLEVTGGTLSIYPNTNGAEANKTHSVFDFQSLEALKLNGGSLSLKYDQLLLKKLHVAQNATISIDDMWADKYADKSTVSSFGVVELDETLTLSTNWKSGVHIGLVTGSGTLKAEQKNGTEGLRSKLWVDGVDDFTGSITISGKLDLMLNIAQGQTLKGTQLSVSGGAAATLTGDGKYDMGSNLNIGVAGLTNGSSWTGTVKLKDAAFGGHELTNYGNANSKLEMVGTSGWLAVKDLNLLSRLVLTKEGDSNGMTISAASSKTYSFKGGVEGAGDFAIDASGEADPIFTFEGDMSKWSGLLQVNNIAWYNAGTTVLNLTGGGELFTDKEAGVRLSATGGTLKLAIGNSDTATVMNGAIINESNDAVLFTEVKGDVTLNASGNIVTKLDASGGGDFDGDLTLAENASLTVTSDIWLNNTINLHKDASFNLGAMQITGTGENSSISIITSHAVEPNVKDKLEIASTNHNISNSAVKITSDNATELKLKLTNSSLTNAGAGALTVTNAGNTLTEVHATGGNITLQNVGESTSLNSLEVGAGKVVKVQTGAADSAAATVALTGSAALGSGSSLDASLNVNAGAKLEVAGAAAVSGDLEVLSGGTIKFGNGSLLSVGGALTLDASSVQLGFDINALTSVVTKVELAKATEIKLNGSWSGAGEYVIAGEKYIADLAAVDNVLSLTFDKVLPDTPSITSQDTSVTSVVGYDKASDMLTLQVEHMITSDTMVSLSLITDSVLAAIQTELNLKGAADDMFGITLQYLEGNTLLGQVVANDTGNVAFYNEKGQGYWGVKGADGSVKYKLDRIPEPTTTTLSLLALMGLAARRRRK